MMKPILAAIVATTALSSAAFAAPTTYIGSDNGVSSLAEMPNSVAASTSYLAAAPGVSTIDFESGLPAGVTIAGGSITSNSGCGALCGFNTTAGGANFLSLFGGSATFSFTSPINTFGFYVTGLQGNIVPQQTVTFTDGSSQVINFPIATNGGGAFIGFTDIGKSISSVTLNVTNDIVAVDDVHFGFALGTPEPATWAMMVMGFGLVGAGLRRKQAVRVAYA